jgi:hypothetical protein
MIGYRLHRRLNHCSGQGIWHNFWADLTSALLLICTAGFLLALNRFDVLGRRDSDWKGHEQ